MSDYTKIIEGLVPKLDGESAIRHRSAVVSVVNSDGTVDLNFNGTVVPDVSVLEGVALAVADVVQVAAWAGDLLVLGRTRSADTAWRAYTPTDNFTVGDGSLVTRFAQSPEGTVHVHGVYTLGSTSTIGNPQISTPVAASAVYVAGRNIVGSCMFADATGGVFQGVVRLLDANTFQFLALDRPATYVQNAGIGATVPFTWATGDILAWSAAFEKA